MLLCSRQRCISQSTAPWNKSQGAHSRTVTNARNSQSYSSKLVFENALLGAEQPSTYDYQVGGLTDGCSHIRGTLCRPLSLQALKLGSFVTFWMHGKWASQALWCAWCHLQQEGFICAAIDMTRLGENITPAQWYKGLMVELWQSFDLLGRWTWWNEQKIYRPSSAWVDL